MKERQYNNKRYDLIDLGEKIYCLKCLQIYIIIPRNIIFGYFKKFVCIVLKILRNIF